MAGRTWTEPVTKAKFAALEVSRMIGRWMARLSALLVFAVAGCHLPVVNPQADAAARGVYAQVAAGADLSADRQLSADMRTPQGLAALQADRGMIPKSAPVSVENRAWRFSNDADGAAADLVHAYRYTDRTVVAETRLHKAPGAQSWQVIGLELHVEDPAPEQQRVAPDPALHPEQT
jgi:hypothetical protein